MGTGQKSRPDEPRIDRSALELGLSPEPGRGDGRERERLVDLAREPAYTDRTDALVALEDRDAAEEERELRVEARELARDRPDLRREGASRCRVAPGGGVRLAARVLEGVERDPVHARSSDD